jgi:hypothetical protein
MRELKRAGHDVDSETFYNVMFRLRDGGFLEFSAGGGMDPRVFGLVRLQPRGREQVEGWPTAGAVGPAEAEALLRAFETFASDPAAPEPQRRKAAQVAEAGRDLGVEVAGNVLAAWLRGLGLG